MIENVDKFARDLPRLTLHGNIPTATTMALAARVVELLDRVKELEGRHHFAPMAVACGLDSGATLDELYERMRELVEIEAVQKSRPMNEAPKDGTWILVRFEAGFAAVTWLNSWAGDGWYHTESPVPCHPDTDEWWTVPGQREEFEPHG